MFEPLILPLAMINPLVPILPTFALPLALIVVTTTCVAFNVPVVLLNVKAEFAPKVPLSLNCISVLAPPIGLPEYVIQRKLPKPSVPNTVVELPPSIRTVEFEPKLTFAAFAKFTVPLLANPVKLPTLVMLGCAAVVTVPAVVAEDAVATLKLATCVVEVTIRGAVPVATLDINCADVVILP